MNKSLSDYSLLISSIEGRLTEFLPDEELKEVQIENRNKSPTRKKQNQFSPEKSLIGFNYPSTAKKLRLAVESDELKIQNEQLHEKILNQNSEFERLKEKMQRQFTFLDQENTDLRSSILKLNEKYYDEKKSWQIRIRTLEAEISSLKKQQQQQQQSTSQVIEKPNKIISNTTTSTISSQDMQLFENKLRSKMEEVRDLTIIRAELEDKISKLEQDLRLLKASSVSTGREYDNADKTASLTRDLERRCEELESALRRKSRELDKYTAKLENQNILEEELIGLSGRLQLAQGRVAELQQVETRYHMLLEEKRQWTVLFKEVITTSKNILKSDDENSSSEELSPATALRLVSATQKKCALALQNEGRLESQLQDTKRMMNALEARVKQLETDEKKLKEESEHLSSICKLWMQKSEIYSGEINSLRNLMHTYDAEFKIGRRSGGGSSTTSFSDGKDTVIEQLREELDKCRKAYSELHTQLCSSTSRLESSSSRIQDIRSASVAEATTQVYSPNELDYDPSQTKVLRIIRAPTQNIIQNSIRSLSNFSNNVDDSRLSKDNENAASLPNSITPPDSTILTNSTAQPDSQKLNQRLKEMFKERISAFREAIYLLTGYKVDLTAGEPAPSGTTGVVSRLRLRSMYAEHPDDSLLFQMRGDTLELLDTPFANRLDPKLFTYLTTCHSVPCFLSNVTLQLFENQTFLG